MAKTTKHVRKNGATTVKQDGKIVANIGAGKTKPPQPINAKTAHMHTPTSTKTPSSIVAAQHKFLAETTDTMTLENVQTLWNLTESQPYAQRLTTLTHYLPQLSQEDRQKFFRTRNCTIIT